MYNQGFTNLKIRIYVPACWRNWRRLAFSLSLTAASKYSRWSSSDSEQVPCFSHSWDQNLLPSLLGQLSDGQFFSMLFTRSDIYITITTTMRKNIEVNELTIIGVCFIRKGKLGKFCVSIRQTKGS